MPYPKFEYDMREKTVVLLEKPFRVEVPWCANFLYPEGEIVGSFHKIKNKEKFNLKVSELPGQGNTIRYKGDIRECMYAKNLFETPIIFKEYVATTNKTMYLRFVSKSGVEFRIRSEEIMRMIENGTYTDVKVLTAKLKFIGKSGEPIHAIQVDN